MFMSFVPVAGAAFLLFVVLFFAAFVVFGFLARNQAPPTAISQRSPMGDYIHYGATLIEDGYAYFPDWSASMLREFDDSIESRLEEIYATSKTIAEYPCDQWPALIAKHQG